uniref:NADH-ubiquinone oxidoreductase chain 2 n=1 Tax=Protankyra bidentata TaxID=2904677 RepID=A0AAU7E4D0_9ECHN
MSRLVVFFLLFFSLISVFVVVSSSNLFLIWVSLELGTFSVVPILYLSDSSRGVEAALKYFVINIIAALIFLLGAFNLKFSNISWGLVDNSDLFCSLFLFLPLCVKIGLAPFHFWFPEVVQGVGYLQGFLVSTWQKISPIYLCCVFINGVEGLCLFFGSLSVLVGGWGGLNQTQVRKILGFSSISFMGWIFCSVVCGPIVVFSLFIIYFFVSGALFLVFNFTRLFSLSMISKVSGNPVFMGLLVCGIISLGGLPPFSGFILKLIPIWVVIKNGNILFLFFLIPGALLSLFFYLRLLFNVGFLLPPVSLGSVNSFRFNNLNVVSSYFIGWLMSVSLLGLLFLGFFFVLVVSGVN